MPGTEKMAPMTLIDWHDARFEELAGSGQLHLAMST